MLTDDSGLDSLSESLVRRRSYMKAGFIFVHNEVYRISKNLEISLRGKTLMRSSTVTTEFCVQPKDPQLGRGFSKNSMKILMSLNPMFEV